MRRLTVLAAVFIALQSATALAAWTERYVDASAAGGGDGTTTATSGANGAWTLAEAATASNTSSGMRVNIKAGTYANTTNTRTFSDTDAVATAPIWFRGYNTTPGDIDTDNTLAKPVITFTTGQFAVTGDYQWFSNLDISGACTTSGGQFNVSSGAPDCRFRRLRVQNTAANSNSRAITLAGARDRLVGSWCQSTSSAVVLFISGTNSCVLGCVCEGGTASVSISSASGITLSHCIMDSPGTDGVLCDSSGLAVLNCSIYNAGSDAIEVSSGTVNATIANCIIDTWTSYAINSSAAVSSNIELVNNAYRGTGSGTLNQVYESENWGSVTESAIPFTNAGSDDFTLKSTASSKGTGFPGAFENESYTGYLDRGAVQRQEAGANVIDPLTGTIPGL